MFTGLVEAVGTVARIEGGPLGRVLRVASRLGAELTPGDSISVSGVCLTVTIADASGFEAEVSPETLRVTTLGAMTTGRSVNLERPLRADARLGGHFVLGHVDGLGRVAAFSPDGEAYWLDVELPPDLQAYAIPKGSIAIDGISLTIASLTKDRVSAQIIPYTFAHTALRDARAGDPVNLEMDVLGKYVVRLMAERGVNA
jgi:riboflavin synthase